MMKLCFGYLLLLQAKKQGVCVFVRVCLCVCERERVRERERDCQTQPHWWDCKNPVDKSGIPVKSFIAYTNYQHTEKIFQRNKSFYAM